MIPITTQDNAVYTARTSIVYLGAPEIDFLKTRVFGSKRKRVRLCVHKNTDDRLQEMLIVASSESYIRPSKHLGKDESTHIVEGAADLVFFDENGAVTQVVPLGDLSSGRRFYCRIPAALYHALLIRSPLLVFHEATHGPFQKSDTVFPSWAPAEEDSAAVQEYMASLGREVERFRV